MQNLTGRQAQALNAIALIGPMIGDGVSYQDTNTIRNEETGRLVQDTGNGATFARSVKALIGKGLVWQGITWKGDGLKRYHLTKAGRDLVATEEFQAYVKRFG